MKTTLNALNQLPDTAIVSATLFGAALNAGDLAVRCPAKTELDFPPPSQFCVKGTRENGGDTPLLIARKVLAIDQPTELVYQHLDTDTAKVDPERQTTDQDEIQTATPLKYEQHPLSAAFPVMQADDYQILLASIRNVGVLNPITLYESMVIDGWHRYTAAKEAGMACPSVELGEVDPKDFVMAQNKVRRHMSQAQLAMATTSVFAWRPHGHQRSTLSVDHTKTTAELADIAGVHVNTITQAKAVQSKGALEVQDAVKRGDVGLPKAAAIAKLPLDKQAAALNKPAPKPAKAADLITDPITDSIADSEPQDNGPSTEELAANAAAQAADALMLEKLLEADAPLVVALEENKRLNAEVAHLKQRMNGLMNEKNEAISLVKSRDRHIYKLEKLLAVAV